MTVDSKTKALLKFGTLEIVCVDMRFKKLLKLSYQYMGVMYILSHMSNPHTLSPAYKTLD